jgi:hypothetical protein
MHAYMHAQPLLPFLQPKKFPIHAINTATMPTCCLASYRARRKQHFDTLEDRLAAAEDENRRLAAALQEREMEISVLMLELAALQETSTIERAPSLDAHTHAAEGGTAARRASGTLAQQGSVTLAQPPAIAQPPHRPQRRVGGRRQQQDRAQQQVLQPSVEASPSSGMAPQRQGSLTRIGSLSLSQATLSPSPARRAAWTLAASYVRSAMQSDGDEESPAETSDGDEEDRAGMRHGGRRARGGSRARPTQPASARSAPIMPGKTHCCSRHLLSVPGDIDQDNNLT